MGCRWSDAPRKYAPKKTLDNRYVRWGTAKGVWVNLFEALAQPGGPHYGCLRPRVPATQSKASRL